MTPNCACARHDDDSITTSLCPVHATEDPCLTESRITRRRRKGTIRRGVCTNCGWSGPQPREPEQTGSVWVQIGPEMQEYPVIEVEFDGAIHRCINAEAVSAFGDRWVMEGQRAGKSRNHTSASAELDGTSWIFATLDAGTFRGVPEIRFHYWETVDGERDLWRLDQAPIALVFGVEEQEAQG